MILICSKGHIHDTENISHVWWRGERSEGGNCPEVMSYDRMTGTRRCNCRLFEIDKRVEKLFERTFKKWYSGNDEVFTNDFIIENPKNGTLKVRIRELVIAGKDIRTGYTCCDIRGAHDYFIAYK